VDQVVTPKITRTFEYHDQAIGDAATHRLVVIHGRQVTALDGEYVEWGSAYGFRDEKAARQGGRAYMNNPDVVGVWVEAVEDA
jgi:hypothetical protein